MRLILMQWMREESNTGTDGAPSLSATSIRTLERNDAGNPCSIVSGQASLTAGAQLGDALDKRFVHDAIGVCLAPLIIH